MKHRTKIKDVLGLLVLSLLFILTGIIMVINNLISIGRNSRTLGVSAVGGHLMILIGVIFLVITYFSLSPFSKIREFFEGKSVLKKKEVKKRREKINNRPIF